LQFGQTNCKRTEPVNANVQDKERMMLDIQHQMEGNRALEQLRTAGVPCHKCGAKNPVADPAAVQVICTYCGTAILLANHVSSDAVARARLKQGLFEMRAGLATAQKNQDKKVLILALALSAIIGIVIVVSVLLTQH
jgi:hypothetical protein